MPLGQASVVSEYWVELHENPEGVAGHIFWQQSPLAQLGNFPALLLQSLFHLS
tara:strand:- start:342 stop:500 length:159 start_codon:yes stop_codon:yes gene_type:complete